jgi:hypothetical protein
MKLDRCWARKLDDCSGKMSREHRVSNVAWPGDSRDARDKHRITTFAGVYQGGRIDTNVPGGYAREHTVAGLTAKVLCTHHNNELSNLDDAAGDLSRALDGFWKTCAGRIHDTLTYTPRTFAVDAWLLQRWFLKTAITYAVDCGDPIGGSDAYPHTPTDELVDIAFGRRQPYGQIGLWTIDTPPQQADQLRGFSFRLWRRTFDDARRTYIAGCFVQFRGLWFAVNFEPGEHPPSPQIPVRHYGRVAKYVRFGEVSIPGRNVRLCFQF